MCTLRKGTCLDSIFDIDIDIGDGDKHTYVDVDDVLGLCFRDQIAAHAVFSIDMPWLSWFLCYSSLIDIVTHYVIKELTEL